MKLHRSSLSPLHMVAGGEKKHPVVVCDNKVMEWVGFGWIELRSPPTPEDLLKYPVVED